MSPAKGPKGAPRPAIKKTPLRSNKSAALKSSSLTATAGKTLRDKLKIVKDLTEKLWKNKQKLANEAASFGKEQKISSADGNDESGNTNKVDGNKKTDKRLISKKSAMEAAIARQENIPGQDNPQADATNLHIEKSEDPVKIDKNASDKKDAQMNLPKMNVSSKDTVKLIEQKKNKVAVVQNDNKKVTKTVVSKNINKKLITKKNISIANIVDSSSHCDQQQSTNEDEKIEDAQQTNSNNKKNQTKKKAVQNIEPTLAKLKKTTKLINDPKKDKPEAKRLNSGKINNDGAKKTVKKVVAKKSSNIISDVEIQGEVDNKKVSKKVNAKKTVTKKSQTAESATVDSNLNDSDQNDADIGISNQSDNKILDNDLKKDAIKSNESKSDSKSDSKTELPSFDQSDKCSNTVVAAAKKFVKKSITKKILGEKTDTKPLKSIKTINIAKQPKERKTKIMTIGETKITKKASTSKKINTKLKDSEDSSLNQNNKDNENSKQEMDSKIICDQIEKKETPKRKANTKNTKRSTFMVQAENKEEKSTYDSDFANADDDQSQEILLSNNSSKLKPDNDTVIEKALPAIKKTVEATSSATKPRKLLKKNINVKENVLKSKGLNEIKSKLVKTKERKIIKLDSQKVNHFAKALKLTINQKMRKQDQSKKVDAAIDKHKEQQNQLLEKSAKKKKNGRLPIVSRITATHGSYLKNLQRKRKL